MSALIDFILHIDSHLINIVNTFGGYSYLILFAIIFIETGAVILPFLPGDSLLFAASAMAVNPIYHLSAPLFVVLFLIACIAGDSLNFFLGNKFGELIPRHKTLGRFIKSKDLKRAKNFFNKYGAWAVFLARFMPIIRTLVPFVAATSDYKYSKFIKYNIIGCVSWVLVCCAGGAYFGNIPFVKAHFSMVILGIIIISLIPALIGYFKGRRAED